MMRALVLGIAALALSAVSASAQVYVTPGYGYGYAAPSYVAPAPVYTAPPVYAAPVYTSPPVYAVPAPLYGYYAAPYGYAPGSREWVIERGW
jgi:hypothetical protein